MKNNLALLAGAFLAVACASAQHAFAGVNIVVNKPIPQPEIRVQVGPSDIVDGQSSPIDFGEVIQGETGSSITFTVWNDGNQTLTLGEPTLPEGYVPTESPSPSLEPGWSDTFVVLLRTTTLGTNSGQISIGNNDDDENPFNFPVIGRVISPPNLPPAINPISDLTVNELTSVVLMAV